MQNTSQQTVEVKHRDLPLDLLAARVGEELETLARLSADVQKAISMCHFSEETSATAIRGLQGVDRITQSLEDLGRLMSAISGEMPEGVNLHAVPILSRLRLHELITNLDPNQPKIVHTHEEADGDIQWF
ncbi:hypothetical protein BFP70_14240 [Thioclava sp. SK-1]|uniref:hypothetical protein n=1 Tax=Thioclava sp. SK-1 TaxID=1889770 RepID=UPI00082436A4|nr:hypothetical protein [Thioclava sp. SK-1]OCX62323.1 hypothetical protein BFP70_14240 [Thioclava sp. SK-1]